MTANAPWESGRSRWPRSKGRSRFCGPAPKPATINREVAFLRSLLVLAARDRLIDRIPYIELFDENNQRDRVATLEEFWAILKYSDQHLKEILFCLWDTGTRKSEVLKLEWDRVDFKKEVISPGVLAKDGQVDTKGNRPARFQ